MIKRKIRIEMRLSESEAAALNRDVKKAGISREAYLRALINNKPLKEKPHIDLVEILRNLQQINNTLNRIASKATSEGLIDKAAYKDNIRWLQDTISKLIEVIY